MTDTLKTEKDKVPVSLPAAGNKSRIAELDMMKGLAIIAVVFKHISELTGIAFLESPFADTMNRCCETFMILFFLCSGYVYSAKGTVWQEIRKKAKQFMIPYLRYGLLATVLYFIWYILIEKRSLLWFADGTLTNFLGFSNWNIRLAQAIPHPMGYAFTPFWFISEMLVAFCLFIPVKKLTDKKHVSVKIAAAALLMSVSMLCNHFDIQHTLENTYDSDVSFFFILINIFGFSAVMLIGSMLRGIDFLDPDRQPKKVIYITAAASALIFALEFAFYGESSYALQYGKWGPYGALSIPVTALGGFAVSYLLIFLLHYLKRLPFLEKALCFVGKNSMYILLLHYCIADMICHIGGFWFDVYNEPVPAENISCAHFFITFFGTAAVLGLLMAWRARRAAKERAAHNSGDKETARNDQ